MTEIGTGQRERIEDGHARVLAWSPTMSLRTRLERALQTHPLLVPLLALFIVVGVGYSVATPIFEAGDEVWHYPFVQYLATGHGLPVQVPGVKTPWMQEGGQPPLYYAMSALATFWIDTGDLGDRLWYNPHTQNIGVPLLYGNKNLVVHTSAEDFPWHNTALAVHLLRLLSLLLSAATVALTYALALEIDPHAKGLAVAAAAFVALTPMFVFISASVNNDNLAVMLATLALWLIVRLGTRGPTLRRFITLGIVLGLAALSKVSDLGLVVVAGVVFVYLLWREWERASAGGRPSGRLEWIRSAEARTILAGSLLCAGLVIVIAGWWYLRNWLLYGDPLAFNVWVDIAGGRPAPTTLLGLLGEFQGLRISFWGNFGGVNLIAPDPVYIFLDLFSILAVLGLVIRLVRRTLPPLLALPALWLAIVSVSLVHWTLLTLASQGRLIFPAIAAIAILFVHGLHAYGLAGSARPIRRPTGDELEDGPHTVSPRPEASRGRSNSRTSRIELPLRGALLLFLLGFTLVAPFTIIAPAYAFPLRMPGNVQVPNPTHITFDGQAELVGYELPVRAVAPGAELPLELYWKARAPMAEDFSVYIRLFDKAGALVGKWDSFPGNGLLPTRLWSPGEVIVDRYRVPVSALAQGPQVGRIEVGLFRRVPLQNLEARDPEGHAITPTIGRFKISGPIRAAVENPSDERFGDRIALVGDRLPKTAARGDALTVRLYWRALAPLEQDYTVFVHLVDANGKTIAQKDNEPQQGTYPTSFWDKGETIADEYTLTVPGDTPAGDYAVDVGIYRASDKTRLPVRGGDHLVLGTISITR